MGDNTVKRTTPPQKKTENDSPRLPCAKGKSNKYKISIKQKHKYKMLKKAIVNRKKATAANGRSELPAGQRGWALKGETLLETESLKCKWRASTLFRPG